VLHNLFCRKEAKATGPAEARCPFDEKDKDMIRRSVGV
jgi:hypothetical protein